MPNAQHTARLALAGKPQQSWTRIGVGLGFASTCWRAPIETPQGTRSAIIKLWQLTDRTDDRELHFYRELAESAGVQVPGFFAGKIDVEKGFACLVLEDVTHIAGDCLIDLTEQQIAAIGRALAKFHAQWWNSSRLEDYPWLGRASILDRDAAWLLERRDKFLSRRTPVGEFTQNFLQDVVTRHAIAKEYLTSAPEVLLHGDFHLDNIVFTPLADQVLLLDWARVGRGPFALELAAFLVDMASSEGFESALATYLAEVNSCGHDVDLVEWVAAGLTMHTLFVTLGTANWSPESEREIALLSRSLENVETALNFFS